MFCPRPNLQTAALARPRLREGAPPQMAGLGIHPVGAGLHFLDGTANASRHLSGGAANASRHLSGGAG
jgi:hypothetical protein